MYKVRFNNSLLNWSWGILTLAHIEKPDIDSYIIMFFWHFWNTISPKTLRNQVERLCFFRVCGGHIAKMLEGRPGEAVEDAIIPPRKLKNKKTAYSTSSYINPVPYSQAFFVNGRFSWMMNQICRNGKRVFPKDPFKTVCVLRVPGTHLLPLTNGRTRKNSSKMI